MPDIQPLFVVSSPISWSAFCVLVHNVSMKYTGVPAGDYTIRTMQHKVATRYIRAYYDVRQYLVDTNTKTILYFYNLSVSSPDSRDKGKYVNIKMEQADEWVTMMNKNVTINGLGEVEKSSSGTERTK